MKRGSRDAAVMPCIRYKDATAPKMAISHIQSLDIFWEAAREREVANSENPLSLGSNHQNSWLLNWL